MQRGLVGALLAVILVATSFVPYWYPPVGDRVTTQWLTLILSVAVILAILVIASHYGIFWSEFLHPKNYRRAVWRSLIVFIVAWPAEVALLIAFFVMSFLGQCGDNILAGQGHLCSASENMGKHLVGLTGLACIALMAIVAVVGAIALVRALILLATARLAGRSSRSAHDAATARGTDGM